jgi:hypothetical protein
MTAYFVARPRHCVFGCDYLTAATSRSNFTLLCAISHRRNASQLSNLTIAQCSPGKRHSADMRTTLCAGGESWTLNGTAAPSQVYK